MEAKFGPLGKRIKTTDINRDEIFQKNGRVHPFLNHERNEEILEVLKVEPVDEKLRRYKSNWLRHVTRRKISRLADIVLSCRRLGRLL